MTVRPGVILTKFIEYLVLGRRFNPYALRHLLSSAAFCNKIACLPSCVKLFSQENSLFPAVNSLVCFFIPPGNQILFRILFSSAIHFLLHICFLMIYQLYPWRGSESFLLHICFLTIYQLHPWLRPESFPLHICFLTILYSSPIEKYGHWAKFPVRNRAISSSSRFTSQT